MQGRTNDIVYLMVGADRFAEYKRVDNSGITGNTYAGVNGAAGVFLFTSGSPDTYTLTDQDGNELTFFGFNAGVAAGQLWTIVDLAGNKSYVGDATTASTAITNGYDAGGRMTTAYDTSGRKYTYTYTQLDSVHRLTQVKAEKNTGSWVTVAQVDYGYYSNETYGDVGDLKTVTVTTPLTDSGVSLVQKKYYRYWEGTFDATTNPGYPHALQYVVDFEGVRRFDWSDSTFDDDHLTASETSLKSQSSVLLAEYRYNGLGHMIGVHEDTDADGDCDGSDVWFYPAYDEGWREVARYRDADTAPKEQFVNAMAGLDGYGGSSYINDVVCRERDNTGGWLAASDGTLEERYFYCPNWRGDVSALVTSGRNLHEMVKYSAYGVPFGLPGGDTNSDGDNDAADATQIQTWINSSAYDVRGDVDLDGDVDSTDKTLAQGAPILGNVLGWASLSDDAVRNRLGSAGYTMIPATATFAVRNRYFAINTGSWMQRDRLVYHDSANLYCALRSSPIVYVDPSGDKAQGDCVTFGCEGPVGGRTSLLPWKFSYGKYCGYAKKAPMWLDCDLTSGPFAPLDDIDRCCCKHDQEVGPSWPGIIAWKDAACNLVNCVTRAVTGSGVAKSCIRCAFGPQCNPIFWWWYSDDCYDCAASGGDTGALGDGGIIYR